MDTRFFPLAPVADIPWVVYVSLLIIAVYFRFSRVLMIRNLDLVLTLLIAAAVVVSSHYRNSPSFEDAEPAAEEAVQAASNPCGGPVPQSKQAAPPPHR